MKLLIFGATGLVGGSLLEQLKTAHEVTIAVRDSSRIKADNFNIRVINFNDFESFELEEYDGVYCCLGTTIAKAGSKENFKKVDLEFVNLCFQYSIKTKANFFCVISALGANSKSRVFYNCIKGEMEDSLIGNQKVIIVRPSLLLGDRSESRPLEGLSIALTRPFTKPLQFILGKYAPIEASAVAKSMIELSLTERTQAKIEFLIKLPSGT